MLLSGLGVDSILASGALAYRSYSKNRLILQTTAGFLLIAGFCSLASPSILLAARLGGDGGASVQ